MSSAMLPEELFQKSSPAAHGLCVTWCEKHVCLQTRIASALAGDAVNTGNAMAKCGHHTESGCEVMLAALLTKKL